MSFAVKYFRSPKVCERLAAAGIIRQPGYVTGTDRFDELREAEKLATHLNAQLPEDHPPAFVVPMSDPSTHGRFVPMTRWPARQMSSSQ